CVSSLLYFYTGFALANITSFLRSALNAVRHCFTGSLSCITWASLSTSTQSAYPILSTCIKCRGIEQTPDVDFHIRLVSLTPSITIRCPTGQWLLPYLYLQPSSSRH